jgi:hypothetical protein
MSPMIAATSVVSSQHKDNNQYKHDAGERPDD